MIGHVALDAAPRKITCKNIVAENHLGSGRARTTALDGGQGGQGDRRFPLLGLA
jgi:hypothetical protein